MTRVICQHVFNRVFMFARPSPRWLVSTFCTQPKGTDGETHLRSVLLKKFPKAEVLVDDISGGCGSMYEVRVRSDLFDGLSIVKQHRLVQDALKDDIKNMHGIRVFTESPSKPTASS